MTPRRLLGFIAVAALARTGATGTIQLSLTDQQVLTPIDSEPTVSQLEIQLGSGSSGVAESKLIDIAGDSSMDPGIRLHAIHALVHYADPATDQAIANLVALHAADTSGIGALTLRAALETLGQLGNPDDYANITPLLEHSSRDIRATAAYALRDLGDSRAVCALRARLQHEATQQVKLAISAALRVLGESPCP